MSVLEALQEQDAELLKQQKDAAEPETPEAEEPAEEAKEEESTESEEAEEGEDESDDDEGEEDEGEEEEEEEEPKDKAKKGWKVRQELKAEQEKREALEKKITEMQSALQTAGITPEQLALTQRQQELAQQQEQLKQNPEPDRELDRDAWYDWKIEQQQRQLQEQNDAIINQQQQVQLQQARTELRNLETRYQKEVFSQYDEAKDFLKTSYRSELKLQYPQATEAQLDQEIDRQELMLAGNAVNGGMNPAEAIKRMAEERGFIAKKETPAKKTRNITKMAQNQKRSANMINRSGDTKKDKLTAEDIQKMTLGDRLKVSEKEWDEMDTPYVWGQ